MVLLTVSKVLDLLSQLSRIAVIEDWKNLHFFLTLQLSDFCVTLLLYSRGVLEEASSFVNFSTS